MRALFPTLIGVTSTKVLGANYGFMVALPFSTIRPERAIPESPGRDWGLNDLYVVALYLGWHAPRADFVAGYGFCAPTGRYEAGANDNIGLGLWSQEIQAGTIVYLDAGKKIRAATTAYLELHSNNPALRRRPGRDDGGLPERRHVPRRVHHRPAQDELARWPTTHAGHRRTD